MGDHRMSAEFERLVGLAVLDADFRERLLTDADAALHAHGFNLTDAERAKVVAGIVGLNNQPAERNKRLLSTTLTTW
jgi:hypothetical protein